MPQYYGVTRSDNYLAHYGIKGMRWGVRKAQKNNNINLMYNTYRASQRQLNKLNDRANLAIQNKRKSAYEKLAAIGAGLGTGYSFGTLSALRNVPFMSPKLKLAAISSAVAAPVLLAAPGVIGYKRAHKRMLPEGHKKAMEDSKNWANEMNKTFKNTVYGSKARPFTNDTYTVSSVKYMPNEAKNGNIMPYRKTYETITGSEYANRYKQETDRIYGRKKRR